jgi:aspartyl-tRNA(Asn)/glutamyl-tRNA(Gln) amidotransferase subunit A
MTASDAETERLAELPAAEIGRQLARQGGGAAALAELCLARAEAQESPVFLSLTAERARAEAAAADARLAAGRALSPLDGVPVAWKDLFDMAGEVTRAGSATRRDAAPAGADALIVRRLSAAGMVSLGRLNMTEFAYSGLGLNPHFGTPHNPHGQGAPRVPGGSSSGSGVAVAAGMAPVAIGTDTGGSVRIPSAFNGITGFKTSEGLVPKAGVDPLSASFDTVGPLARNVEDCALVTALMCGASARAPRPAEPGTIALYVPDSIVFDGIEPGVAAAFETALEQLSSARIRIERGPLPIFDEVMALTAAHGSIVAAEAWAEHRALLEGGEDHGVDPRVVARIRGGETMTAHDLLVLQRARPRLQAELERVLNGRLLAFPTVAHVAPEIAPLDADMELFGRVNLKTLRNTLLGNFLNTPGVAMPCGTGDHGLPASLLLSAPAGEDQRLLSAAATLERLL